MGNCKCQNDTSNFEIVDQKNQLIMPKKQQQEVLQKQNQIQLPKLVSHQPTINFGKPIDFLPQLNSKMIEVDTNLGQFIPFQQQQGNNRIIPVGIAHPFKLSNGVIYQGEWYRGNMHGNGTYYLPDGSFVRGYSRDNQLVGKARFIRQNGNYYEGYVQNNKANGQGVLYQNGVLYKGRFVDNFLEGNGIQQSQKYRFQGKYHNGAKISGKLVWDLDKPQHTIYQGGFFDQQFNGQGTLTNHVGKYQGLFENGKKKGHGVFTWKNGDRFQGNYDNDVKNGQGKMSNSKDLLILQGHWVNGKLKI